MRFTGVLKELYKLSIMETKEKGAQHMQDNCFEPSHQKQEPKVYSGSKKCIGQ